LTLYFAYGANMDPVHMAKECPGAIRIGPATLAGYRFGIARAGYGTVRPDPGSMIRGVLWQLPAGDEAALDRFEGVPEGLYYKSTLRVSGPDGIQEAMLYRATDPAPGKPAAGYLERVIEVAESLEFPPGYIEDLRASG
jgi:gamma-glutamylcyclotransferase (GGCT)/AIG2-like uncharacterized protein YtfP